MFDIIKRLQKNKIQINLYEPELEANFQNMTLITELKEFISQSDIIIANRMSKDLNSVKSKVFTRDLFGEN